MKTPFVLFIDGVFVSFLSFILSFILLNYFVIRPYSIVIALSFAVIITLCYREIVLKKNRSIKLSKAEREAYTIMVNQLNLSTLSEQSDLISKLLIKMGYDTEKKGKKVIIKNKKIALFMHFSFDNLTKGTIVIDFNQAQNYDIYLLADKFSDEIKDFAYLFNGKIHLVEGQKLFKVLDEYSLLPAEKIKFKVKEKFPDGIFMAFFSRKNYKKYLLFGFMFLFMSYFVPLKLYYIISGSVFLLLALISLLFGKEKDNI